MEQTTAEMLEKNYDIHPLYDDVNLLVVVKPSGMVTRDSTPCLQTIVRENVTGCENYSPAHRLDKGTSGIVAGGKNRRSRRHLSRQFQRREVDKKYLALVEEELEPGTKGIIESPLWCSKKGSYAEPIEGIEPKSAKTMYQVLWNHPLPDSSDTGSLLRVEPFTGRQHQIRAHLPLIGGHIYGDARYGLNSSQSRNGQGQYLHAAVLSFLYPLGANSRRMRFVSFPAWLPEEVTLTLEEIMGRE